MGGFTLIYRPTDLQCVTQTVATGWRQKQESVVPTLANVKEECYDTDETTAPCLDLVPESPYLIRHLLVLY